MQKYEYTQSIGFRLKGDIESLASKVVQDQDKLREVFLKVYRSLLDVFAKTVLHEGKDGNKKVSKFITVKYPFLKLHAKEQYFSPSFDRSATKAYSVKDAPFLHEVLLDWLGRNEELYNQLHELLDAPEESQASKSDILYKLKQLYGADNAFFIRNFMQYASHKKDGSGMQLLQKRAEQFNKVLEIMLRHFAPQQSSGAEVARASFNYYTLNKTAKDYDEEKKQRLEEINSPYLLGDSDKNLLRQVGFVNYIEAGKIENLSIEELYVALKDFKSKQKADFVRDVQGDKLTPETFAQRYPLFTTKKETFLKFYEITKQLDTITGKEARDLAKKRGKYFQQNWGFKKYVEYNKLYKRIAIQFGKLKAELRSIKQERVDARLLKFWAMVLEDGEKKLLLLVPKEKRVAIRKYIEHTHGDSNTTVSVFHSFTLRALEKIIRKQFPKDVPRFNEDEKFFIKRVKQVLRGEYEWIDLSDSLRVFGDEAKTILNAEYKSKDALRKDFDRLFYKLVRYSVDKQKLLAGGALLFEISAYDLERDITAPPKAHTKLWQTFWSDENMQNFSLRLNPEIRIFYRETIPQNDSDGKKQHNRFSRPQLRVQFSLTHNVGGEVLDAAFKKDEELQERFSHFNTQVIDPWINNLGEIWYYGIDRGNQELATLGIIKWSKKKYEVMLKDGRVTWHNKPVFASFATYTIKDPLAEKKIVVDKKGNKTRVLIGQNPSLFMGSEEEMEKYFVKNENQAFLDLTTAKLIKGKIVENGDVKTYLNLKRANAKRKLFEVFTALDPQTDIEYCDNEKHPAWYIKGKNGYFMRHAFVIKNKETERSPYTLLCYFSPEQKEKFGDIEFKSLQEDLNKYLHTLHKDPKKQTITIEQINHLRDAITANMMGIIVHLFKQYPGFINLENLLADADRHFASNNENIARRLEWALYRKFQKEGLVPPRLRNTLFLRKDAKFMRLGIIHFVPTEHTSGTCPRCLEKADTEKRKEEKWSEHAFTCTNPNCGFSTQGERYEFGLVSNSDDVASCNIANPNFLDNRDE